MHLHGISLSKDDCNLLWGDYSEMRDAGFLNLPDSDTDLWVAISTMLDNIIDD
jgi:hypothetical protein